ncbi:hypothetical protein SAMN02927914_06007 [Mesorhizobium qingshengii]|uniref:Uncharacterized protein n=1 Tax=Mesorhizobium qingshengii TaxID=1165689 RepID=A0A1G5ZTA0_9HYPH|nr:hypothetical protein SAMN02927914_06007 [Mesorhizobium qingshengii]
MLSQPMGLEALPRTVLTTKAKALTMAKEIGDKVRVETRPKKRSMQKLAGASWELGGFGGDAGQADIRSAALHT